ncbi:MAG: 50S ribosomal protein L29 [Candidatus Thorarchaeota archaeon]|jgi:large subunit ribosomal protein L29
MARLTAKDIRRLTPPERQKRLEELYNELTEIRIQMATGGGTENPYRIRNVRRAIARILTIQSEMEREEQA